ncbi:MAG: hypothetical protein V4642_11965 [Bacteroidota bacterium]
MSLSFAVSADIIKQLFEDDSFVEDYSDKYQVSSTFCELLLRELGDDERVPEFEQISRITDVDISPLYQMLKYCDEADIESVSRFLQDKTEEERNREIEKLKSDNAKMLGNIDIVILTLENLITALSKVGDLAKIVTFHEPDRFLKEYFADDSFGQDLRNFKRFAEFAKSKGANTLFYRIN